MPGWPVSLPCASAIMAAPPSWRHTVTRDVGIVQRIEHRQVAFAGHAKELLHTMGDELLHQDLAAGAGGERGRVHISGIGSKIQNRAWQARWMRAQASCKSAVDAAYEMRKYGASPSTPPGTTATWCSRSR